jgi:hypothetical protein
MSNILGDYRGYVVCPLCQFQFDAGDFMQHVSREHPYFFVVWASFSMPEFHTSEHLFGGGDDMSYEFLSELCDQIGYHREGVGDIDSCTDFVTYHDNIEVCPICIESISIGRKINSCKHVFCQECIETWLNDHKTCPVCVRDVTVGNDQMSSISISSAADGSPPHASSSSMNTM